MSGATIAGHEGRRLRVHAAEGRRLVYRDALLRRYVVLENAEPEDPSSGTEVARRRSLRAAVAAMREDNPSGGT